MARSVTLAVTSGAGLASILAAAAFGSGFASKLTDGYSLGMALANAVALACYAIGLRRIGARKPAALTGRRRRAFLGRATS